jgi:glutathione synthase/RimK-type ligase-like ATP-grasp enzyme
MTAAARRRWAVWRRPRGTPSVLFVDDSHWAAFTQLSPLLRRKGVRTIRITTEVRVASRLVSSLLFDRHAVVAPGRLVETLQEVLRSENVVDVQFVEALSGPIGDALGFMGCGIVNGVEGRLAAMDKISLSRRLDASGIRVPAIVPMPDVSPGTVARTLGFPVVLKARVGSSGDQILIVHDLPALNRVAAIWWEHPERYFYEKYVDGEKYNYAAAVGQAGIEQELTYRVSAWRQPTGSASQVETVSDVQLAALGRRALEVVGCTGLVNIDVIRDRQGVDWLIDFNPRAFGGSASFLCAGLDISEGYLRAIGQTQSPPARRSPPAGVPIRIFPACLGEVIASGSMTRAAVAFWRESKRYLRWLGLRYWLVEALVTTYAVAGAARKTHSS